jgi:NAD-dependent dihydropyrimidine dehydrogenase PreA subunit
VPEPLLPAPRPRVAGRGRPLTDAGCAGCGHLHLLRALRRAGLEWAGGLGCEPRPLPAPRSPPAITARLASAAEALRDPAALLASPGAALIVGDRGGPERARAVASALAGAGARVASLDPAGGAAAMEAALAEVRAWRGPAALVALTPCARGVDVLPPFAIDPARCSRCGACLGLGCVAISDPGGEAVAIDPAACTGCGLCAPLCRSRAIVPR